MKGASVNTLTSVSLSSWLTVHAFSEVMKTQTADPPTAASVLAAFKAAKDIPMNGIIKPWTPTAYAVGREPELDLRQRLEPVDVQHQVRRDEHLDDADRRVQHLRRSARHHLDDRRLSTIERR